MNCFNPLAAIGAEQITPTPIYGPNLVAIGDEIAVGLSCAVAKIGGNCEVFEFSGKR